MEEGEVDETTTNGQGTDEQQVNHPPVSSPRTWNIDGDLKSLASKQGRAVLTKMVSMSGSNLDGGARGHCEYWTRRAWPANIAWIM